MNLPYWDGKNIGMYLDLQARTYAAAIAASVLATPAATP